MDGPNPEPVVERQPGGPGGQERAAVILLLIGGAAFLVGWLAGCLLLWLSPNWRWTDKVLGTLIWPGGLVGIALVAVRVAWPGPPPGTVCDPGAACVAFFWPGPPLCGGRNRFRSYRPCSGGRRCLVGKPHGREPLVAATCIAPLGVTRALQAVTTAAPRQIR